MATGTVPKVIPRKIESKIHFTNVANLNLAKTKVTNNLNTSREYWKT
jgi:hypothetical protein